jgi:hypothetical protein
MSEEKRECSLCTKEDGNLMCGRCYYERFKKEMAEELVDIEVSEYRQAREAAKRAAGIDPQNPVQ